MLFFAIFNRPILSFLRVNRAIENNFNERRRPVNKFIKFLSNFFARFYKEKLVYVVSFIVINIGINTEPIKIQETRGIINFSSYLIAKDKVFKSSVKVKVDSRGAIPELNEKNNSFTKTIKINNN